LNLQPAVLETAALPIELRPFAPDDTGNSKPNRHLHRYAM